MFNSIKKQSIECYLSYLDVDSEFDVKSFLAFKEQMEIIPNIRKNRRNNKETE